MPTPVHNLVFEVEIAVWRYQLSINPEKPALKRVAYTSLLLGVALLGLRLSTPRWLQITARSVGVLALLLAVLAVVVIFSVIQVISI